MSIFVYKNFQTLRNPLDWYLPRDLSSLGNYSCVLNTSHTVLGDMPDFYQKLVCITRHVIQFYQRPGWNTEHTNSLLMWQWHHFCFEVTREGLRPGWNCRHGKLFTQRPGWNKRILRKIQCVLIKSPVTCIQDQRVHTLRFLTENCMHFDNKWILSLFCYRDRRSCPGPLATIG